MGVLALEIQADLHHEEMISFLSSEEGYWLKNDKWSADSDEYKSLNLGLLRDGRHLIADFSDYKNEAVKIEAKYAILLMMKEKTITFTREASSAFLDNQLSEHILMALSSYEHKTTYSNHNPDKKAGELEIVLKYWPEDEAELEEELRLLSNQCGVKDSVNVLFNPYFISKEMHEKEVKKEVFFYKY